MDFLVALVFLAGATFLVSAQPPLCPHFFGNFPDGNSCVTFLRCRFGLAFRRQCPRPLPFFDRQTGRCTNQEPWNCLLNNQQAQPLTEIGEAAVRNQPQNQTTNAAQTTEAPPGPGRFVRQVSPPSGQPTAASPYGAPLPSPPDTATAPQPQNSAQGVADTPHNYAGGVDQVLDGPAVNRVGIGPALPPFYNSPSGNSTEGGPTAVGAGGDNANTSTRNGDAGNANVHAGGRGRKNNFANAGVGQGGRNSSGNGGEEEDILIIFDL